MTNTDQDKDLDGPFVYMFAVIAADQGRRLVADQDDEPLMLQSWLDAFVDLNEERLRELLERSCQTWGKGWKVGEWIDVYLQCFWEEDDDEVLCKSTLTSEQFEERLPIPRGLPFKNKATHKRWGLDVEE